MITPKFAYSIQEEGAAQTLLLSPSARATSLGEALTALDDEVAAAHYNPATVTSLIYPQVSVLHQQQFDQETYSHLMMGATKGNMGYSFSAGNFDVGSVEIYGTDGFSDVDAQRDLVFKTAVARKWNSFSIGIAGSYFTSTLIESKTATAWAGDLGLIYQFSKNLRLGTSLQNVGTKLKYNQEKESLPRLLRAGAAYKLGSVKFPARALVGFTNNSSDHSQELSAGFEVEAGPLAFRAGGRKKEEFKLFSMGAGIKIGKWGFDYDVDLIKDLNAEQKFSLKYWFEPRVEKPEIIQAPQTPTPLVSPEFNTGSNRVYTVQSGDTWESLASRFLNDKKRVEELKRLNQHLKELGPDLVPGQKILLP